MWGKNKKCCRVKKNKRCRKDSSDSSDSDSYYPICRQTNQAPSYIKPRYSPLRGCSRRDRYDSSDSSSSDSDRAHSSKSKRVSEPCFLNPNGPKYLSCTNPHGNCYHNEGYCDKDRNKKLGIYSNFNSIYEEGKKLKDAHEKYKNCFYIVSTAVKTYGNALEYASDNLKNDFRIVQYAVGNNPESIKHASKTILSDRRKVVSLLSDKRITESINNLFDFKLTNIVYGTFKQILLRM